jgi:flavin reductase (DIM6/NTAB) family NADH-FMN oxidoreductase RutF
VATAVRRSHPGHRLISEAWSFAVSFVGADRQDLARVGFAEPGDRLEGLDWSECPRTLAPVVNEALGYIGCEVRHWVEGGDHDLVVAEVVVSRRFRQGQLLTIHDTPWTYC